MRRLYYDQPALVSFRATVTEVREGGLHVYLDQTAFYPESGGQPADRGTLNGVAVLDVVEEGGHVLHVVERPIDAAGEVEGVIDWRRRFDHMQQHTGQHLLSAVLEAEYGWKTVSFHLGADASTIDLEGSGSLPLPEVERRVNEVAAENRPVLISYEDAGEAAGLRKASDRSGTLRIISIESLDRSACGGTHVASTGQIGATLLRRTEKIRNTLRLEFLCGGRAVRAARADYDAISQVARVFSSSVAEAPALVAAQQSRLADAEKARTRLSRELAEMRGREAWARGERFREIEVAAITDDLRAEAQAFVAGGGAALIAICRTPPSLLVACSADAPTGAGEAIKSAVTQFGGRGGGSRAVAQASFPGDKLDPAITHVRTLLT